MNLFLRIFISFWLAALLLAGSFFLLGRYLGGEVIEQTEARLNTEAQLLASYWLQGGHRAVMPWFREHRGERLLLLDQAGQPLFPRYPGGSRPWPFGPPEPGVKRLRHGRVAVVVALPEVSPPLYLVKMVDNGQLRRIPVVGWLLILFAVISAISYLLARRLSAPIRQLRAAVQGMAAGQLSARVDIRGRDEVASLASDFNRMAARVEEMLASQRQLVSDVSHELRSPLSRLRIALELAERNGGDSRQLQRIAKEADELESLVTGLLSLARIESGQSRLEMERLPLCTLLQQIVEDAQFEAEPRHIDVVLQQCDGYEMQADPVLLHAAIENVVRNAIRHSPDGGVITLLAIKGERDYRIRVSDEGPGVPPAQLERLFEPFARVAEARDRNTGGFGLGLAISGKAMAAHGGRVWAENRAEGGLAVTLALPLP